MSMPTKLGRALARGSDQGQDGLTTAEREELVRLRKELRIVQEEREILKKATAFFGLVLRKTQVHEGASLLKTENCWGILSNMVG